MIDVSAAVKAFSVTKGVKCDLSQRINPDGTVEGIMFWLLRFEGAASMVERAAGLSQQLELKPSVNEKVERAFALLLATFIEKGVNKCLPDELE